MGHHARSERIVLPLKAHTRGSLDWRLATQKALGMLGFRSLRTSLSISRTFIGTACRVRHS